MVGLGKLAGQPSQALAISGDGLTIVGVSGNQAFRWTQAGGIQGLGFLPGGSISEALGVSLTGTVIVGRSGNAGVFDAFVWTQSLGMKNLKAELVP